MRKNQSLASNLTPFKLEILLQRFERSVRDLERRHPDRDDYYERESYKNSKAALLTAILGENNDQN